MTAPSFPPPNFIPAPSALEGIDVYRPKSPDEEDYREVVEFKCPQCGADTAYSAADGGLTCTHCSYYEAPRKAVVGKAAESFEFTVDTMQRAGRGWGQVRKELQCQGCGAYTSIPPETLTSTCPFCGSSKVIQRAAPQDVLRPRFLIPFKLDVSACQGIVREWLGTSWMTPDGLRRLARMDSFSGVYLPFWMFDATTQAEWQAEVGHTEGSGKNKRTVWEWRDGRLTRPIHDVLVVGTSRLSLRLLGQIKRHDFHQLAPYEPEYLAGFQAQSYDVPLEQAWQAALHEMREQVRQECHERAEQAGPRGKHCRVRNLSLKLDFDEERWRYLLLPVYLAPFRYQEKTYQVMINGQTGAIAGQRPVDWVKIGAVVIMLLLPGLVVSLLSLIAASRAHSAETLLCNLGPLLIIGGLVLAAVLIRKAQRLDDV